MKDNLVICSRVISGECLHDCDDHRRPHDPVDHCSEVITYCEVIGKERICVPYRAVNKEQYA